MRSKWDDMPAVKHKLTLLAIYTSGLEVSRPAANAINSKGTASYNFMNHVRSDVLTAMTMKTAALQDVTP
jgi:hypothetical protein